MFKNKFFWIILILVIAGGAGGYYYYTTQAAAAELAAEPQTELQTAVARKGDLSLLASGAGSVTPAEEISLGFDVTGTLVELHFAVGEQVEQGQVLASLQTKNSQESIDASIADAELAVLKAQKNLDDLYANADISRTSAMNNIANYAQQVRDAQYQLDNYTLPTYLQGLDPIEALDQMKASLDEATVAFEPYRYYPTSNEIRQELLEALSGAQTNYDAAVKRLNYEHALQVAQANLNKARSEYEKYQEGPAVDDLTMAQAELANAQAKLALAKENQAVLDLTSPMSGTVMAINAQVGEAVGTTAIITLANLQQPMLEVYLDETDLDKVAVGNPAEAIFDALPEQTFSGKVVAVDPSLATISGVQAIRILVQLDPLGIEMTLPVGLNASVDVIGGQAKNAILVPVEALREISPGEYAVFVIENGEPVMRLVQVGLVDITSAEIISGIEAGETISTGIVATQ
ncbi:MAG: efflux RND transporter periplasmic adaptor subunit [Anaerolineales bacterium]